MRQKINVGKLVDKGRELWEKHGDDIIAVVKKKQPQEDKYCVIPFI